MRSSSEAVAHFDHETTWQLQSKQQKRTRPSSYPFSFSGMLRIHVRSAPGLARFGAYLHGLETQPTKGRHGVNGAAGTTKIGALAQLGEHLLCKQRVIGSIPIGSTSFGGGCAAIRSAPGLARLGSCPVSVAPNLPRAGTEWSVPQAPLRIGSVAQVVRAHA